MSKISDFLARKASFGGDKDKNAIVVSNRSNENKGEEARNNETPKAAEAELTVDGGTRLGAENEALRSLVVDAARKIEDLDNLKLAFGRIIDPLQRTLVALEQEKSHNASLVSSLNESRSVAETLRAELQQREKNVAALSVANEKLQHEIEQVRHSLAGLESTRIELLNEVAIRKNEIADFESKLSAESIARQSLTDEHRIIADQAQAASKRLGALEAELITVRQKLALAEDEKRSLQLSLDQTVAEVSRISRQLLDANNSFATAQTRLGQIETGLAETESERTRLIAAFDEAKERHRSESSAMTMRIDALQSRAATAEKLLTEARANLAARADEIRDYDRKMTDATIARNAAEKKLAQLEGGYQTQERQIKDLEQARAALVERNTALSKNMRTRETELARSEEKLQSANDLIVRLEEDIQGVRSRMEKRIEELNATLERERMDRAVAEGALEATRKDNARLTRENSRLEATLRQSDESPAPAGKRASKATVEPIVKS